MSLYLVLFCVWSLHWEIPRLFSMEVFPRLVLYSYNKMDDIEDLFRSWSCACVRLFCMFRGDCERPRAYLRAVCSASL